MSTRAANYSFPGCVTPPDVRPTIDCKWGVSLSIPVGFEQVIQFWKGNETDYNVVSLVFFSKMVKDLVGFV